MSDSTVEKLSVGCCIAGGGPAGMMLGFLLARAGVEVAVLEKHADFLRDFRGDTIHPSTLEVLYELATNPPACLFGLRTIVVHLTRGNGSKLKNREREAQGEQDDAD